MKRYACLELITSCGSCDGSVPVNGPFREVTCHSCFEKIAIPPERIADFINSFEEDFPELDTGQGRKGTVMSGSGTYKYRYWRMPPRCEDCKIQLELPDPAVKDEIKCPECGRTYYHYPAPEWFMELVPSAVVCVASEPPDSKERGEKLKLGEGSSEPIVMSCPSCGGSLTVSAASKRLMVCDYCETEVYVPDPVWKRLHPVMKTKEWFVVLQGKTKKQILAERRLRDQKEEQQALKKWKRNNISRKAGGFVRRNRTFFLMVAGVVAIGLVASILSMGDGRDFRSAFDSYGTIIIPVIAVLFPLWIVARSMFGGSFGRGKKCKQALAQLADKHGWKHEGAQYRATPGYIRTTWKGRDIEIQPNDDYAVEVEVHDSVFHLKTEPPGWPREELFRFTADDEDFNRTFPIRYARPDLAEKIESSPEEAERILAPVNRFREKWRGSLGRFKLDWSGVAVNLVSGQGGFLGSEGSCVPARDLEPLFKDVLKLAEELDEIE